MANLPGGTRYYTISGVLLAKTCRKCRKTRDIEKFKPAETTFDRRTTVCSKCLYADEVKQAQAKEPPKKDSSDYHRRQVEKYRSRTDTELSRVIKDKYPDGTKKCVKCNNTYELSRFYRNKSYPTGISYRCRKCHKA